MESSVSEDMVGWAVTGQKWGELSPLVAPAVSLCREGQSR